MQRLSEEKEHLQKAFEEFQLKYSNLAEEHKTIVKQLKDADMQLITNIQKIRSLNRDKERKLKELD